MGEWYARPVLAGPRMRREILPGYELDDDRERIDVAAVHRFLSEEAYWALGRPFDTVALLVRNSYRVLGLYHGEMPWSATAGPSPTAQSTPTWPTSTCSSSTAAWGWAKRWCGGW
jgi:hypothetical protein